MDQERSKPLTPKWRSWRRLIEVLVVVAVLLLLHGFQTRSVVRGLAPEFQARTLGGATVNLKHYQGQPLLLQFWATWCPVCTYEQDSIDALAREHAVLTIAMDDLDAAQMQAWLEAQGVSYPVVLDTDGRLSSLYGVEAVPSSIIIDPAGHIRFVEVGYTTAMGLRLRLWWAGL